MIKLFAFDLDGTTLDSNSNIDYRTIKALKKLDENGIKFIFSTGRVATSAQYIMEKTGLDNPIIGNNGSIIYLNKSNILNTHHLDMDTLIELQNYARENKLYYHFYDADTFYSESLDLNKINHLKLDTSYGMNYQVNLNVNRDPIKQITEKGNKALKIQMVIDPHINELTSNQVMNHLKDIYSEKLYITTCGENIIEVMVKEVSKWKGVLEIADFFGIEKDEIAAIGDQDNDLPMIEGARYGFAMGNSIEKVKQAADFIVASNNNLGVVEAIEKVLELNKNV